MRFLLNRLLRKAFSIYQCLSSIFSSPAQHMKLYSIAQRTAGKEQNLYLSMGACRAHSQTLCNPLSTPSLYKPLSSLPFTRGPLYTHISMFLQCLQWILAKGLGSHQLFTFRCALPLMGPIPDFKNTEYLQIGRDSAQAQEREVQRAQACWRFRSTRALHVPLKKGGHIPPFLNPSLRCD